MWERFEELMKAKRLRIADVARETGISYSTFTDWKAGRYTPKADKIQKLADFFDVSYEYIMGTTNRKKENTHRRSLQENIMKSYLRSLEDKNENNGPYPVYLVDSHGKRQLIKLVDINDEDMPTVVEEDTINNQNDAFFESLSDEQKDEITRLYQLYQNASPEVRSAVELLLKTQSRES